MPEPHLSDLPAHLPAHLPAESLTGWLARIEARHGQTIALGLERVARVRTALGADPHAVVITVGGTNGKGSTCAMLEAILRAEGYAVGCYTSPHLLSYNERVRINGEVVADDALVRAFAAVEAARGDTALTYFEHGTLAAWQLFRTVPLDVIILEVGLGGRLDAVNVIDPDCAIVTGVALDHMDYLGDNREAIAFEKAGIFRPGRPAICGDPHPPQSLIDHAATVGARLWTLGRDFGFEGDRQQWAYWRRAAADGVGNALTKRGGLAFPALRGNNQLLNAAVVITALDTLRARIPVSMQAIRQGLMLVELAGRFQVLPGQPTVVLDVAHNPQAAGVLADNLSNMGFYPETWAVFGMLADKDVDGVIAALRTRVDHWLPCTLPGPRGLAAEALEAKLSAAGGKVVDCFASARQAFAHARKSATESDRIVTFGSFLTVADVLAAVRPVSH
ncbi:bifunctional folylpolyglutamate synthase/dihydrofolate synthase [Betaproteobacteria bacterium]|nr:bifunctional folylpolyglutamate synthase/dihydrofolate synthase [Betaproteobacteria bacterium]GHU31095.1 bifunctional folylpolyglutamate synthase/dihydrofolate synthase [Betaproteobacteria bacterium]